MIFILMVTVKNEKKICCGSLGPCKISPHALALVKTGSQEPRTNILSSVCRVHFYLCFDISHDAHQLVRIFLFFPGDLHRYISRRHREVFRSGLSTLLGT